MNEGNNIEDNDLAVPLSNASVTKEDNTICLLCLQIPNEWFSIEMCGCQFCRQVNVTLNSATLN